LSRRREHLHARALQIRAELGTHIHRETGPQRPTHSFWSFLFEKTKLECGKKPPAFRQRQAHNAVRHAAPSRPARSAPGHRARIRESSRVRARICRSIHIYVTCPAEQRSSNAPAMDTAHSTIPPHFEYAERGKEYGILFIFSLFCEYIPFGYL